MWYSPPFSDACGNVPLENTLYQIAALPVRRKIVHP
jgi:hypothetical protein